MGEEHDTKLTHSTLDVHSGSLRNFPSLRSLPAELIAIVLAPLGIREWARLSSTSQTFQVAALSLFSKLDSIDLKNGGVFLGDSNFVSLTQKLGTSLKRMELDCWHLGDRSVRLIPLSVTDLALCGADHHTDEILLSIAEKLGPSLERFCWSGFGGQVTESGFRKLAGRFRSLTSFSLDSGEALNPNSVVRSVAESCPNLTELSAYDLELDTLLYIRRLGIRLRRFRHKRRRAFSLPITDSSLVILTGMCPFLEELVLTDHTEGDFVEFVTDVGLLALTERASTLKVLKLRLSSYAASSRCSEVAIMELANLCTKLTRIELCNFKRVTDPPFYEIVHRIPFLIDICLDSSFVSDASMELLAFHCPKLKLLSIKFCRKLTERGIAALGRLKLLESLNASQASGITDQSVASMCRLRGNSASCLRALVLNYSPLSDSSLESISSTCSQLEELALHSCTRITNSGLKSLAAACPRLRYLSLSSCDHISDAGVMAIAEECKGLQKIRLDSCRLLTNPSVRSLCRFNQRLKYLSMQHCNKISDGVFEYLNQALSLRFVDLGRAKLSFKAAKSFTLRNPLVECYIDGDTVDTAFNVPASSIEIQNCF